MSRRAFTLMEVLLAIALTTVVAGGSAALAIQVVNRQRLMEAENRWQARTGELFDVVGHALVFAGGGSRTPALDGSSDTLTIAWRGVTPPAEGAVGGADLELLGVTSDPDTGLVVAAQRDGLASGSSFGGRLDAGGQPLVVEEVARLRFRYWAGGAWSGSFRSSPGRALPGAVEIAVWRKTPGELRAEEEARLAALEALGPAGGVPGGPTVEDLLPPDEKEKPPPARAPDRIRVFALFDASSDGAGGAGLGGAGLGGAGLGGAGLGDEGAGGFDGFGGGFDDGFGSGFPGSGSAGDFVGDR